MIPLLFITLTALFSYSSLVPTIEPVKAALVAKGFIPAACPENTIFAFDMHKVFMKQNFWQLTKSLAKTYHFSVLKFLTPSSFKRWHKVGEVAFSDLEKQHPKLKGISRHFEEFMLNQPFMLDTVDIIKGLKHKGYKIYVLSNCAQETYEKLQIKFPAIFTLFDGEYLPNNKNNYHHKPQLSFYKGFKSYVAQKGHNLKQIIFIDDKKENIVAAREENILGIQFENAKKLHTDIQKLEYGLLV